MDEKIWYYASNGEQKGPIDAAEMDMLIGTGTIGPETLVWRDGMSDWLAAAVALPEGVRPTSWGPPPAPAAPPVPRSAPQPTSQTATPPPSDHPTQFMDCVKTCFNKYSSFRGRARRPEYWYFVLFNFLVSIGLGIVDAVVIGLADFSPLSNLYSLAVLVPSLAVTARRLHDTGRSGWWQLLWFIPIIGWIVMIVWLASRGNEDANEYGPA